MYENGYNYEEKANVLLEAGFGGKDVRGLYHKYVRRETIVNLTDSERGTMQVQQHADKPSREELSGLIDTLNPDRVIDSGFNDIDLDEWFS